MTPTITAAVAVLEARVRDFCKQVAEGQASPEAMMQLETEIRGDLDVIGREAMGQAFKAADFDEPEVLINGIQHSRVRRYKEPVHTSFGSVEVEKTSYRKDQQAPPVAAMDKALGLVEGGYTPKCAKILCLLTALAVREDVVKIVGEFGGMTMGSATIYRVPQIVMARYEVQRKELDIDKQVRERSPVPPEAAIVQFGMDGVMVPQDGEHCDPRGRTPSGDPAPPRHEQTVGTMPASPRDDDGKEGIAWHEASVGTMAFFDKDGNHLQTTYLGRMPEALKATLEETLTDEAKHIGTIRPDLLPVFASDGAEGQWSALARIRLALPGTMQARAFDLLDLFHMGDHLQDAADVIYGKGSPRARVARVEWIETLKAYEDGLDRVRQCLRNHVRQTTRKKVRKEVNTVLTYLKNNRLRAAYKLAEDNKLPLATGPTEAAAKSLVGVRMKRSGARYSQHGGQTILTLLAAHKSGRFDALWEVMIANCYAANVTIRSSLAA
jgi:hypothetical protein